MAALMKVARNPVKNKFPLLIRVPTFQRPVTQLFRTNRAFVLYVWAEIAAPNSRLSSVDLLSAKSLSVMGVG